MEKTCSNQWPFRNLNLSLMSTVASLDHFFRLFFASFSSLFFCHRLPCFFHPNLLFCPDCCSYDPPSPTSPLLSLFLSLSVHPLFHFPVSCPCFTPLQQQAPVSRLSLSLCFAACLSPSHTLSRHILTDQGISTPQQLFSNTATGVCMRVCVRV